nr:uncharacterized protein LOC127490034 isoform X1 [Oryctolagus cuniculus]
MSPPQRPMGSHGVSVVSWSAESCPGCQTHLGLFLLEAPGASGVRAGPASPPLGEAPTAGFLGAWAWASRDTTQEHLPARLYPGSQLQLAVSVSSELKSWPRRVLAEVLLAGHFSIRPAPGASGVRAGPASPPLGEAPTAGFLGAWASASRDTTQEHLATRLYPVTTAESREVPCLSCTPDGSLESPCQTSDCCSTGRHVECQCPRLAPVPGLRCPRTTGSWLQLAVSVSSELKSWPRRVLAEVLLAGHFSIRPDPCVTGCLFSSECVKIQRFTDTGTMILLSLSF